MKIKQLDISGFKSFCDHTRIVFNQPITAVVGPNGCGKSNIVDAIRWALGEQSAKNLRGKGMEDVIFNGSETRGPQSLAEVTITFDNTDGRSHPSFVDYPEISVTRRLHRDGTSEYLINRTNCRLLDITDLFLGTGAGVRAYSIIEQGRIGLIVSARSEDRRLLIEEAAGITKFKSNRKAAERRMELTRQNVLRLSDLVAEIERNLTTLRRQAQKAERYRRYSDEKRDLELFTASHRWLEGRARLQSLELAMAEAEQDLATLRGASDLLETDVARLRLEENEAGARVEVAVAEASRHDHEIEILEKEILHVTETRARIRRDELGLGDQSLGLTGQRQALTLELVELENVATRWRGELAQIQDRCAEASARADEAQTELRDFATLHERKRDELARGKALRVAAEMSARNLERNVIEETERLRVATDERDIVDERRQGLIREAEGFVARVEELIQARDGARRLAEDESRQIAELVARLDEVTAERRRVRDELQSGGSRLRSLEELQAGLERHDRAVRDALGGLRRAGEHRCDTLLVDVIDCEPRFEVALAAALGDRLQAVVVGERAVGLELLERLRGLDAGRLTVLAAGPGQVATAEVVDPAVLGRLSDLARITPPYEAVVEGLLTGVFVVETLADAERLWQLHAGRATFVTLDGQLLEREGALRGGRPGTPEADLLHQKRELRELAVEVERLTEREAVLVEQHDGLRDELARRQGLVEEARRAAQGHEIALAEARKDHDRAAESLQQQVERIAALTRRIAQSEERLTVARAEHERALREIDDATATLKSAEAALATGTERLEALRDEAERLQREVTELRIARAALEEKVVASRARREQAERQLVDLEQRMSRMGTDRERLAEELGRALGRLFRARERREGELASATAAREVLLAARGELDEVRGRLLGLEQEAKLAWARVEETQGRVQDLRLAEQEAKLSLQQVIDEVWKVHHLMLTRVIGDYHLRESPTGETQQRIEELDSLIARMGPINLTAIEECAETEVRFNTGMREKNDLEQSLEDLEKAIDRMDRDARRQFQETFVDVNTRFQEIFPRLFNGGMARLALTDPDDVLGSGVDIIAQPPGKRLGNIELMSGGEKALTAAALLFAMFLHRPSPFCLLDEVDAPLDSANVGRFCDMVREMTTRSQFVIVTHDSTTMEKSDALYGVTMEEPGVSKIVSVRLKARAEEPAAATA